MIAGSKLPVSSIPPEPMCVNCGFMHVKVCFEVVDSRIT